MTASSWLDAGSSASASAGSSTSTSRSRIMLLTSEEMRLQDVDETACVCRRQCRAAGELMLRAVPVIWVLALVGRMQAQRAWQA